MVPTEIQNLLLKNENQSAWYMYKLARQAMRYGQYPVAVHLFSTLSHLVSIRQPDTLCNMDSII